MKRMMLLSFVAVALLTACVVAPGGRRGGVALVPLLPPLVVLDVEPYYFQDGFHYHYTNGSWFYATSRSGPWTDLPRDHYPREVRFKENAGERDRGRDNDDQGRGRDRDRQEQGRDHDNRR
jgi:hypothetical protein